MMNKDFELECEKNAGVKEKEAISKIKFNTDDLLKLLGKLESENLEKSGSIYLFDFRFCERLDNVVLKAMRLNGIEEADKKSVKVSVRLDGDVFSGYFYEGKIILITKIEGWFLKWVIETDHQVKNSVCS